jgi:hypothetical protein
MQELAEVAEFGFFPHETVADEDRMDGERFFAPLRMTNPACGQFCQHHATVEAAADQGANGNT